MHGRIVLHMIGFVVLFSTLFILGHMQVIAKATYQDTVVMVGFYSMVGFIFSVVSGFVIQTKWQVWDRLVEASHGELMSLRQLHLLVRHLPVRLQAAVRTKMKDYLDILVQTQWKTGSADASMVALEDAIYSLDEHDKSSRTAQIAYDLLVKTMHWKEQRENYSRRRTPSVLKTFLFFGVVVICLMSLVLPAVDIWLNYVFTLSIGMLAYSLFLMIDDLDHPYRPGGWHLSDGEYKKLLEEIGTIA